ncbi:uncharacterized protein LOC133289366 isoform X2 [Gastrolobium bilobum]|nr:uncharacterized protein LOC133289366 isoform X2 [Gastrolobium bilobum]
MNEFLNRPIVPSDKNHFEGFDIVSARPTSVNDWNDVPSENNRKKAIDFVKMPHEQLVTLGIDVINGIHSRITTKTIVGLFLLAYNSMDGLGKSMFDDINEAFVDPRDRLNYDEMKASRIRDIPGGRRVVMITMNQGEADYYKRVASAFCFVAGTYMRLFTKSAENYMRIEESIRNRYGDFYAHPIPLNNFHPGEEATRAIKSIFENHPRYKDSLYCLLYSGNTCDRGQNIKAFMYDIHLAYTGLHCIPLFARVMSVLKKDSVTIGNALYSRKIADPLRTMMEVNAKYLNRNATTQVHMWKYGRIFNSDFLSDLQTKHCVFFNLVLAYLLRILQPEEAGDVLRITHLAGAGDGEKAMAECYARRFLQILGLMDDHGDKSPSEAPGG